MKVLQVVNEVLTVEKSVQNISIKNKAYRWILIVLFYFLGFTFKAIAQNAVDGTFVFCDSKGNEIANGSVVNVTEVDADEFGGGEGKMHSGLFVKYNGTGNGGWAGMSFEIKRIDNGKLQHCFPGQCYVYTTTGTIVRKEARAVKKGENQNINSEWMPVAKGLCIVTYTVHVADRDGNLKAQGPTVTVCYDFGNVLAEASKYDFKKDGIFYKIVSDTNLLCSVLAGDVKYSGILLFLKQSNMTGVNMKFVQFMTMPLRDVKAYNP